MELVRASARVSCAREILRSRARSHLAIACTIAQMIVFDWSRVQTPGLARDRFLWVQGSNPCPCSTIFSWVQGSIPWPGSPVFRPCISLAYVTRPHEWSNRWHRRTKKLLSEVKKTCLHEWWPLLYGEVERYLLVTKA